MNFRLSRVGDRVLLTIDIEEGREANNAQDMPEFVEIRRFGKLVGTITFGVCETPIDWDVELARARWMTAFPGRLAAIFREFSSSGGRSKKKREDMVAGFLSRFDKWEEREDDDFCRGQRLASDLYKLWEDSHLALRDARREHPVHADQTSRSVGNEVPS